MLPQSAVLHANPLPHSSGFHCASVMGLPTNPGLIPLCLMYVFKRVRTTPGRKFLLRMSYLEIYKEVLLLL